MDDIISKDFQVDHISAKQKAAVFNTLFSMQKVSAKVLDSLKSVIHVLELQWEFPRGRVEWWEELLDENANTNTISSYMRARVAEDILKIIIQAENFNGLVPALIDNCDAQSDNEELAHVLGEIDNIFEYGKKIVELDVRMNELFNEKYFSCDGKTLLQEWKNAAFLKSGVKAREEGKVLRELKQLLKDVPEELTKEITDQYLQLLADYSTLKWHLKRRTKGLMMLFDAMFKTGDERTEILQDWESLETAYNLAVRLKEDCRYFVNTKEDEAACIDNMKKKVYQDYDKFLYVNKELFERYLSLMEQYTSCETTLHETVGIDFENVRLEFTKTKRHKVEHDKDDWFVFVQSKTQAWMNELESLTVEG